MLCVGKCVYHTVLVAGMETMRTTTWELLEGYRKQGGRLVFAGEAPGYVDVQPSEKVNSALQIPFEKEKIVSSCSAQQIKLTGKNASGDVQMRKTGQETLIFC